MKDPTDMEPEAPYIHQTYDHASFLSKLMYSYATPLISQAYRKLVDQGQAMTLGDCLLLPNDETTKACTGIFQHALKAEWALHPNTQ